MNLSFAGCGFLGIYHVGVAVCFKKYAPHLLLNEISGASFGALAACSLLCDVPIGDLASDVLNIATEARSRTLGPFHPSFNIQKILTDRLDKILPEDAHIRVSGRLHISLTRVTDGKNIVVSEFSSRDELIQALNASCFIPFFSGILPPRIQGFRCMDGGFSDNLPTLDENTITVSPFCGESDICPRDDSMQLFHINVANTSIELSKHNIYRIGRILFPPKPEILSNMCKQGFDDALRFLHRNNLINCTRCLSVQSTFTVQTTIEEGLEFEDPECHDCKTHRQEALVSNLPDAVLAIFQEAINSANKGLANWIFKHRGMKVLSVLTLPYTLPADVMVATLTNAVGETYEKHNLEYNVVTRTFVRPARKCKCGNMIESRAGSSNTNNSLIGTMPAVGSKLWELSSYFASHLINRVNQKENRPHIVINEDGYIHKPSDIESGWQANVTLNQQQNVAFISDNSKPVSSRPPSRTLSRRSSLTVFNAGEIHLYDDTFENIVEVANNHESIMSYYYSTGDNKVNVMEIFDVSESDSPAVQSQREKEANQQLEFDDDWETSVWMTGRQDSQYALEEDCTGVEITPLDDVFDQEQGGMFSDPESEWSPSQVEEFDEDDNIEMKSECDQMTAGAEVLSRPYEVPSFTYSEHSS